MRPLLTDYKLCKYINKFYVSFNTPFTLVPGLARAPHFSVREVLWSTFTWCRSIEHVAPGWQGFSASSPATPPLQSRLETPVQTDAAWRSLTRPSSPRGTGPSSWAHVIYLVLEISCFQLSQQPQTNCLKSASSLVNNSASLSLIFPCLS